MKYFVTSIVAVLLLCGGPVQAGQNNKKRPQLESPSRRDTQRATMLLAEEVRQKLVTLPYYDVFDWLEGDVRANGTVALRGQVTRPVTKSDAENRVKKIESVSKVVNQIEVLPLSQFDDQIRRQVYRAIFRFDSPLHRYSLPPVPPIHIIVKGGRVTLKGVVLNTMDRQLAETYARGVPDVFAVKNELAIEKRLTSAR
jgi:osmotically-inducible protein OsmY